MALSTPVTPTLPADEIRRLEDQLTELAAHIHAANYRFLTLIRRFDETAGWSDPGIRSCAHWLNWKCGIGLNAAREKVRVAHALGELPKISASFSKGEISYSKVRAMTRAATDENEEFLLMVALHGTASHVERAVRQFRRARRNEALDAENERHERRRLVWHMDEDGCWVMHGRFTPEQGERIMKAVDAAMDEINQEQKDVSAETSRRLACDCGVVPWRESADGETLDVGRKTRSIPPAIRRALQRRDGGCRFPGCTALRFTDAHHVEHWADGGETKLDNLVTLCRHHHRAVHEGGFDVRMDPGGQPVFLDRRGERIPEAPPMHFRGNVFALMTQNRLAGVDVSAETCIPDWHGEQMDDDLVVESLYQTQRG